MFMKDQNQTLENEILAKNLKAPRVTLENLQNKIKDVEICKFISKGGGILRWAVLTMENGFAIVGKPSASVSPENDDAEIGEKVAIQNSQNEIWALEGYLLKERLYNLANDPKSISKAE